MTKVNTALWEARLDVAEQSLTQYRETAHRLSQANDVLTNQQYHTEKDTIDIISLLKRKDTEKEEKIIKLEEQMRSQEAEAHQEQQKLVAKYTLQINELQEKLKQSSGEFNTIQRELKTIKEFRKKKAQLEQELSNIKESMVAADRGHKDNLARMEHKFFSEKVRLEKEAEKRIAELAERAHKEAIVQLDNTSRTVFKENVRLNEALNYHLKEVDELKKLTSLLTEENASMALKKEMGEMMIKKNAAQMKGQREEISNLKAMVATLEQDLELKTKKYKQDNEETQQRALVCNQAAKVELEKLQKVLVMREKELGRIKRLAGSLVAQRTDLEVFFHEILFQVRQEIQASRKQHRKEALQAYHWKMNEARAGRLKYPFIRTPYNTPHSTNYVFSVTEEAEKWTHGQSNKVDIADLTWEQKEKVLRLLFAKMNGQKVRKHSQSLALSTSAEKKHIESDAACITEAASLMTFMTQPSMSDLPSNPNRLPDKHTM